MQSVQSARPTLGPYPADLHRLDPAHHAHVGRANFGYAVARAYAGHTETGATVTYVRASLAEVAAALAALTGEPHPLATSEGW